MEKKTKLITLVVEITQIMLIQEKWSEKNQDILIVIDIILVLGIYKTCWDIA